MTVYEPVIGLEVHAQLNTRSKLFCGCSTAFGASPNAHTCEVCLGMPGCLPVPNKQAVTLAVRAALGLECTVHPVSVWSRKNYFYPDLPKGYQITQFDKPVATGGRLAIDVEGTPFTAGITRIHMEEDAGKNVHDEMLAGHRSFVDFNRGGTPLVEIVGEPDLRSSAAAASYLKALRQVLRYLEVCDGNMEEGSLRCDANVSIRPVGQKAFGTRVELKNINSFRFVQQAIDFEILRQTEVLEGGGRIIQETRLWDTQAKCTRAMRGKEEAHDYRYFPEPDLPPLVLPDGFVDIIREALPELPAAKEKRYVDVLGLTPYDAQVLCEDAAVARYFEDASRGRKNHKAVANWVLNELLREVRSRAVPIEAIALRAEHLGELVDLIEAGTLSGKMAKELFGELLEKGGSPKDLVASRGLTQVSDLGALEPLVETVLAAHPDSVKSYLAGKVNILGFLVGQVMQKSKGKANPKLVSELLRKKMDG